MIILDIPNWMIYITWFILINIGITVAILMWLWVVNKIEIKKDKQNGRTVA
jgi:hypothetical protein